MSTDNSNWQVNPLSEDSQFEYFKVAHFNWKGGPHQSESAAYLESVGESPLLGSSGREPWRRDGFGV